MGVSCSQEGNAYYKIPYYCPNNISTMAGLALLSTMGRIVMKNIVSVILTACDVSGLCKKGFGAGQHRLQAILFHVCEQRSFQILSSVPRHIIDGHPLWALSVAFVLILCSVGLYRPGPLAFAHRRQKKTR